MTQQAASASEQISTATTQLSNLADQLKGLVERFRLGAADEDVGVPARR